MKDIISKVLKGIRKKKGIKQNVIAAKAGIKNTYLSQIESGKKIPTFETLENICLALEVPQKMFFLQLILENESFMDLILSEKEEELKNLKGIKSIIEKLDKTK